MVVEFAPLHMYNRQKIERLNQRKIEAVAASRHKYVNYAQKPFTAHGNQYVQGWRRGRGTTQGGKGQRGTGDMRDSSQEAHHPAEQAMETFGRYACPMSSFKLIYSANRRIYIQLELYATRVLPLSRTGPIS